MQQCNWCLRKFPINSWALNCWPTSIHEDFTKKKTGSWWLIFVTSKMLIIENNKPGDIHLETYIGGLVFGKKYTLRWRGYRKSHEIFSHANKKCATVHIHDKGRTKYNMIRCSIWICCLYDFLVSLKLFRSDLAYEDLVTKYWSSFKYKTLRTRKMIHAHKV